MKTFSVLLLLLLLLSIHLGFFVSFFLFLFCFVFLAYPGKATKPTIPITCPSCAGAGLGGREAKGKAIPFFGVNDDALQVLVEKLPWVYMGWKGGGNLNYKLDACTYLILRCPCPFRCRAQPSIVPLYYERLSQRFSRQLNFKA